MPMHWPQKIVDDFVGAIEVVPPRDKEALIRVFLDTAARLAVWRAKERRMSLEGAYQIPFTPIGRATATLFERGGDLTLKTSWPPAVHNLLVFVRGNAGEIMENFEGQLMKYDDGIK